MPLQAEKAFGFATLAIGKKYRVLASLLAKDIEKYSPDTSLVIVTDNPGEFSDRPNVLAFKHQQQGVKCWHDKRFAIAKALELFNTCILVNADLRILGQVPPGIEWPPGITARSGCSIIKHNKNKPKALAVIKDLAEKLNLDLQQVKWINEFLFIVKRDSGKEIEFLRQWDKIAPYFELRGVHDGEGNAIGLATLKAGLPLRIDSVDWFPFFQDRIEQQRIKGGQIEPQKLMYFEIQKNIENPQRSKIRKLIDKVSNYAIYLYRSLKLKIVALGDFEFYYLRKIKQEKQS